VIKMKEINLKEINQLVFQASFDQYIVPGFNVFGHEDATAVIRAAELANSPVLLMINRDARQILAVEHWGALLNSMIRKAKVPVGIHLDHCSDLEPIIGAINSGFTSVMYDGSALPLAENIAQTKEIVHMAHAHGVAVEGEVGAVPYDEKNKEHIDLTSPEDAAIMHAASGLDWLAISIGNIHRMIERKVQIDFNRHHSIEKVCPMPLVIHGASGLLDEQVLELKKTCVAKLNYGTVLRLAFGNTLREEIASRPDTFDRLTLMKRPIEKVEERAYALIMALKKDTNDPAI